MNTSDIDQIDNALALNILQQIPTPVMAVNRERSVIFLNKAGLKMIGKSWEEIKGMPCRDVFKSSHCGTDDCRMKQVIDGGQAFTTRNEMKVKRHRYSH